MPRNIEYHIEERIKEENFPLLVLTIAIQEGLDVPEDALEVFGSSYAADRWVRSQEYYSKQKIHYEEQLAELSKVTEFSWSEIMRAKGEKYLIELNKYNESKIWYEKKRLPLLKMRNKLGELKLKNEKQKEFSNVLRIAFDSMLLELDTDLRNQEPMMETPSEVNIRLQNERTAKINEAKDYLIFYDNYIKFDDAFFLELIKDWFNAG